MDGTLRALAVRWRWALEQVPDGDREKAGAAGASAMDHLRATLDAVGYDDLALAAEKAPRTTEVVHTSEHHLYAAGRVLVEIGAGAPRMIGHVDRINSSDGGVPKRSVPAATISYRGLAGDRQATRKHHGRPGQALSLWSGEVIDTLAAEGHPIAPGLAGENLTVRGIDWSAVRAGSIVRLGGVTALISGWADPCFQLKPWFVDGDFRRIDHDRYPGASRAYAAVLTPGEIRAGSPVVVEP